MDSNNDTIQSKVENKFTLLSGPDREKFNRDLNVKINELEISDDLKDETLFVSLFINDLYLKFNLYW